jgi:nitrate reductase NapE component
MPSRSKAKQSPKRKRRNWQYTIFIIFGLLMVVAMVVSAVSRY